MKITNFKLENVKRVELLEMQLQEKGLVVIGGKNGQGKTSVLDGIAAGLGGAKFIPSNLRNDDAKKPATIRIELNNGLVVERKGKNAALTVTDPEGKKAGQKLLDKFISAFALDLPAFLNATTKEKAQYLLDTLGIGDKLSDLERQEKELYDERTIVGRQGQSAAAHANELPEYPDAPLFGESISELAQQQQEIMQRNAKRQTAQDRVAECQNRIKSRTGLIATWEAEIEAAKKEIKKIQEDMRAVGEMAKEEPESTEEIEEKIRNIETNNAQIAANKAKADAESAAEKLRKEYAALTEKINSVRDERMALLDKAELPLKGLSVEDGELVFDGQKWDCMSGSQQLRVAAAIASAIKPECKFLLLDKLEQMDAETMREFGKWAEAQNLQIIATRVTTNPDECKIIIEDGKEKTT